MQCKPKPAETRRKEPCVLYFDRVAPSEHIAVARAIEKLGYKVVGGGVDAKGKVKLASDIRFVRR